MRDKQLKYSVASEKAYYAQHWPSTAPAYRHLRSYVDCWLPEARRLFEGKVALDIGAGEATYTRMVAEAYAPRHLVACELFRERMIPAMVSSSAQNLTFVTGNCLSLPFADETFDVVFGSLVLCQIPELDLALSEIDRTLKPGGAYVGIEPNPYNAVVLYRFIRGRHSPNQYLINPSDLSKFASRGFDIDIRFFYARFPSLRNRFLTTCMGVIATKPHAEPTKLISVQHESVLERG